MTDADTSSRVKGFPAMAMPGPLSPWIEKIRALMRIATPGEARCRLFRLVTQPRFHDDERFHAAKAEALVLREGERRWRHAAHHDGLGNFSRSQDMVSFRNAIARTARRLPCHGVRFAIEIGVDSAHLGTGDDERLHTLAMQVGSTDERVTAGTVPADRLREVARDLAVGETMDVEGLDGWPHAFGLPDQARQTIAHYKQHTWGDPSPIVQASRLDDGSVALHLTSIGKPHGACAGERRVATILAIAPAAGQSCPRGELAL